MPNRRLKPGPKKTTLRGTTCGTDTYDHTEESKAAQAFVMNRFPAGTKKAELQRHAWIRWAKSYGWKWSGA